MDDQDRIKYLEMIERVLVVEWTKTQDPDSKSIIDKSIRLEKNFCSRLLAHTLYPLIFHSRSEITL
jgi:hypothetical protein